MSNKFSNWYNRYSCEHCSCKLGMVMVYSVHVDESMSKNETTKLRTDIVHVYAF